MLTFPQIDPVAFAAGPLKIHWYGIMYLVGFAGFYFLGQLRAKKAWTPLSREEVGDLLFYGALGAVLGGRIGYILFYDFAAFVQHPLDLLRIWEGGMSFHGGMLGVFVGIWLFARKIGSGFFQVADFVAPMVPIGLAAGRIGNFINGELWGRSTDVPWAMVFPAADALPRHPSQLYQFMAEGVILFLLLWWVSSRPRRIGLISGLFLIGYGIARFVVEFARQPDAHLNYVAFDWMSMGQLLSLPMLLAGVVIIVWSRRQPLAGQA